MISIKKNLNQVRKFRSCSTIIEENDIVVKGILFLKNKGVFSSDPQKAQFEFNRLLNPSQLENPEARGKYEKARTRLISLVSTNEEIHSDSVPDQIHQFTEEEFAGYNKDNVYFLKNPNALSQRFQRSGLCYMHAPAMVQHYAVKKFNNSVPMIDLLHYIKNYFSADQLQQHVFENEGGDSAVFLENILMPGSVMLPSSQEVHTKLYQQYGPALVSKFKLHEDFWDSRTHRHYGRPKGASRGFYAMVLVGHRIDKSNNKFYLLQNWWKEKQFVEVDEEYLKLSGANVTFIETPQIEIPTKFSTHYGKYYELEGIDKPEGHAREMRN